MPTLAEDEARRRFAKARVARLATRRPDGRSHLVPIVFALVGDGSGARLCLVVDDKPKRGPRLQRLDNIAANPEVSILVDAYDEEWSRLWWVRADGLARRVDDGPEYADALDALRAKYPQYREPGRRFGPAIVVGVIGWSSWSAT